jgi:hypothetical protein
MSICCSRSCTTQSRVSWNKVSFFLPRRLPLCSRDQLTSGKITTGPLALLTAFSKLSPRSLRSGILPLARMALRRDTLRQLVICAEDDAEAFEPVEETGRRKVGLYLLRAALSIRSGY